MDKLYIGIRTEDKSIWERRTPLPPHDCKYIMEKHPRIQFIVQPSLQRIFTDEQYQQVGCIISEDLTLCKAVICVKEIPAEKYIQGMTYLHWSHITKPYVTELPVLNALLEKNIRLIDYEEIFDDNGYCPTQFAYGGIAGILVFLHEFGKFLSQKGIQTPLLTIKETHSYFLKNDAYLAVQESGTIIAEQGLPNEVGLPLIIGVLGSTGLCGQGSIEVLSNLPITFVQPNELKGLVENKDDPKHKYTIYVCKFKTTDLVRYTEDYEKEFISKDYYEHPNKFTPVFHSFYLQYLTIIVNDITWDTKFPRYITNDQIKNLVQCGNNRLQAICDVSCDLEGSIQFLKKFTTPDKPVYYYEPLTDTIHDDYDPNNPSDIMYMAIDFLPCQLPYDASIDFGISLRDIVPFLAYSDPQKPIQDSGLPESLQKACIAIHGTFTQKYEYLNHYRNLFKLMLQLPNYSPNKGLNRNQQDIRITITGNMFHSDSIYQLMSYIQKMNCQFDLDNINVEKSAVEFSSFILQLQFEDKSQFNSSIDEIQLICSQQGMLVE